MTKRARAWLWCGLALACSEGAGPGLTPRTFRMGFSAIPPRPDQAITLQALNLWTSGHADAAIMHVSVPYRALLSGLGAPQEVRGKLGLADYYRAKGLPARRAGLGLPGRGDDDPCGGVEGPALTLPPGSILPLFAHLGLVDSALGPKPALAAWDRGFARPLAP